MAVTINLVGMLTAAILISVPSSEALRDVRIMVPQAVRRGESATLMCLFDTEGDSLYAVKWYKGRREFYRFTPKEVPQMKIFPIPGIEVEMARSNESHLTLAGVELGVSGHYSCEVSADAPSFHTYLVSGSLEVVEPPRHNPVIVGVRPRYKPGDILRGNCTSKHSRPAANLTWQINGQQANVGYIRHYRPVRDRNGLETSIMGIHFVVTHPHFVTGRLKIRCIASIHAIYWKSTEKSIEEDRPRIQLIPATAAPVGHNVNLLQPPTYLNNGNDNSIIDGEMRDQDDSAITQIKADMSATSSSRSTTQSRLLLVMVLISQLCLFSTVRWK